jgi:DNA/RNA-binding domain of Phe-tRNA-synthetase-like protein
MDEMAVEIQIELPGVRLGSIEAHGVTVSSSEGDLARLLEDVSRQKQRELNVETLAETAAIRAVRSMFRGWQMDPSKYRPSSEALLRRVVQGKGLYRISNVVDIGNLGSIETGWPYGCYDLDQIDPPVVLRHGAQEEMYEGIGKRTWHLRGRPVLADNRGPFGSPISDSTRSMIQEATKNALIVIYQPSPFPLEQLSASLRSLEGRLSQFASARSAHSAIWK